MYTTDNDLRTCKYSMYVWASGLLCISLKLRTIQKSPVLGGSFASLWYKVVPQVLAELT